MSSEPVCIHRTSTVEEADIIVAWLEDNDIAATIFDPSNPGVMAFGVTDVEGIQIFVADPATAERAKVLLDQHQRDHAGGAAKEEQVKLKCEECGELNKFASDQRGTVQACGGCGGFLDVPGSGD